MFDEPSVKISLNSNVKISMIWNTVLILSSIQVYLLRLLRRVGELKENDLKALIFEISGLPFNKELISLDFFSWAILFIIKRKFLINKF
jgi:hypothetical protein